ncbi:MAG: HNH endonuclease [Bryobacteraceae bacterium]|jgi:hypothetical protein
MTPLPPSFARLMETGSEEVRAFLQNVRPVGLSREPEELPAEALDDLCWIWQGAAGSDGFAYEDREPVRRRAYKLLVGPIPARLRVECTCGGRLCVNPRHLRLATQSEIASRANPRCRLAIEDREAIRKALATGEQQTVIARRFGVGQSAVSAIKRQCEEIPFAPATDDEPEKQPARSLTEWLDRQDRRLGPVGQLARGEDMSDGQREKALSKATREFLTYQLLLREYEARRSR